MTRRGGAPRALAGTVAGITKPLLASRGFAQAAVIGEWPAIVGKALAEHTWPERIAFAGGGRTGGTLHLRTDGGALATELQHLAPQLIERVNGYFGYRAVARLKLIQGTPRAPRARPAPTRAHPLPLTPSEEEELARRLDGVADEALRAALAGLGRALMGKGGGPGA